MANKFTRIQPKSRYLEAANALTPLTMLTGQEALTLARAGQEQIGTNEELVYKYRDEFLYIQRAAEQGLTSVDILIDDPNELSIVAQSWGFVCTVLDKFSAKIVYRKNLGQEKIERKLSNINIDWSKPKAPTVDVAYYRQSGNLVVLEDSTLSIPVLSGKVSDVKLSLGITDNTVYNRAPTYDFSRSSNGRGGALTVNLFNGGNVGGRPITDGGSGYAVGDTIIFPSYRFKKGFNDNRYNLTIVVTSVDKYGSILNIRLTGLTASDNYAFAVLNLETGRIDFGAT